MTDLSNAEAQPQLQDRISNEEVRGLADLYAAELLAFLTGVLRDAAAAQDVSQITFHRLLEVGHTAQKNTIKGWLFQVAMREALAYRRRTKREMEHLGKYLDSKRQELAILPNAIDGDEVERVRDLLKKLSAEQQDVVRLRIYEGKSFATIAADLKVPLGTVLTRMRLALEKLRTWLGKD
ncbi:RNA polymerase sigma factor [Schlesneria paludicola]|uniref:RNA polymerase sigma factor n=1 Tax=Schlesneria paludicola TaxID=360056 RepID=UPI0002D679E9|nr:RNA polymerase sigma factor [Schlesneria paludicola]